MGEKKLGANRACLMIRSEALYNVVQVCGELVGVACIMHAGQDQLVVAAHSTAALVQDKIARQE